MKLLLDTHIWIWSLNRTDLLAADVRDALENPANPRWLSPVSVWETQILMERGRISLARDAGSLIREAIQVSRALEAPITHEIALESRRLVGFRGDPVDRFLVATARVMGLTLVTADTAKLRAKACPLLANR